ncbi:CDI toxin immunity protein, partial [Yersinia similis]
MTLFEECKEALSADFIIVKGRLQKDAIDIFNKYPLVNGNISWSEIEYSDYEDINHLLNANSIENDN